MQGVQDTFRANVGPFDAAETLLYSRGVVDAQGHGAESATRSAVVQRCQKATPKPPTPMQPPTLTPVSKPAPTPQKPRIG